MAKSKNTKSKKADKPAKKQAIAKKSPAKKTAEKKAVKKIIPTKDNKPKKSVKEKSVKDKKTVTKEVKKSVEKTKKTATLKEKKVEVSAPLTTETKSEAKNIEEVLNVTKTEQPVITPVVEEKKEEAVVSIGGGILPVDDDDDDKLKENSMGTTNNPNNNVQKVYTFNKGIEFMDGHLKIGIDGTNVSRRSETIFDIYGKSEHGAEFKTEFECIDKEEADYLSEQLNECEKNNAPFMKGTPSETPAATVNTTTTPPPAQKKEYALDANGNIDMTKLTAQEIMSIQNGNLPVEEKKPQDFVGIPLSAVNIDDMINNLPPKTENQNINTVNTPISNATPVDMSNILNSQNAIQVKQYAQSIADHINTSFQANVWGGMPQNDARNFLANCDKQYLYELLSDDKGFYLIVKRDTIQVRMPENPNEYLKVK